MSYPRRPLRINFKSTNKAKKDTAKITGKGKNVSTNPLAIAAADANLVKKFLKLAATTGNGSKKAIKVAQAQSEALKTGISTAA